MPIPAAFVYNNRVYLKVTPTKRLFNSTTVYEVINRGDVFAVDLEYRILTVIPGNAQVEPINYNKFKVL